MLRLALDADSVPRPVRSQPLLHPVNHRGRLEFEDVSFSYSPDKPLIAALYEAQFAAPVAEV